MSNTPDTKRAAESWQGRWMLDGFENRLGCVRSVEAEDGAFRLQVLLEGGEERTVWTEPRDDGEFVHPDRVDARYRMLSPEGAREEIRKRRG